MPRAAGSPPLPERRPDGREPPGSRSCWRCVALGGLRRAEPRGRTRRWSRRSRVDSRRAPRRADARAARASRPAFVARPARSALRRAVRALARARRQRLIAASDRGTLWRAASSTPPTARLTGFADWQAVEPGAAPGDPAGARRRGAGPRRRGRPGDRLRGRASAAPPAARRRSTAPATRAADLPPALERPGQRRHRGAGRCCPTARCWRSPKGVSRASGDLAAWLIEGDGGPAAQLCREPPASCRPAPIGWTTRSTWSSGGFSLLGGFATPRS